MRDKVGDKQRLGHILDAIADIERGLIGKTKEDFYSDSV
jgi:hypothetical protein